MFVIYGVFHDVALVVRPLVILSLARVGGAASPFGGHLSPELYADAEASLLLFQSCVLCHVFLFFFLGGSVFRERCLVSWWVWTEKKEKNCISLRSHGERVRLGGVCPPRTLFNCSSPQCLHFERSHTNRMLQH